MSCVVIIHIFGVQCLFSSTSFTISFHYFSFTLMAGLKADLDSYLSNSKASSTLSNLTKSFSLPTLKSPFGNKDSFGSGDDAEALLSDDESNSNKNGNSWFANAQNDYCPSLTKKQRIFGFVTCLGLGLFFFSFATLYVNNNIIFRENNSRDNRISKFLSSS